MTASSIGCLFRRRLTLRLPRVAARVLGPRALDAGSCPGWFVQQVRSLSTHGAHLTITATGPGTVLELVADQGAGTRYVISVDPGASDITIERLAIETSAATNTDMQTHAIEIGLRGVRDYQ